MNEDFDCPYCGKLFKINRYKDEGVDLLSDEKQLSQAQCPSCDKYFVYETYIVINHSAFRADCLNGSEHCWEPGITYPKEHTKMYCLYCGEYREPTSEEMISILDGSLTGYTKYHH